MREEGLSVKAAGESDASSAPQWREPGTIDDQEPQRCACTKINFYTLDARRPLSSSQKLGRLCDLNIDSACNLCRIISVAGRLRNASSDSEVHIAAVHTSVLFRCRSTGSNDWWQIREVSDAVDDTTSYVILTRPRPVEGQWEIRQAPFSGFISPVEDATSIGMWYARKLGRRVNMQLVKSWLEFCNNHHVLECFNQDEADFLFPLRVIDCASRKVVWWLPGSSYIALSYVLGGKEANFHPKSDSMPHQLPHTLASTIEDAILVTEALGIRYLWVDQYCIEQDNAVDKAAQIGQMDLIYRHAWLTIVAAAGRDVDFGLPGVSSRVRKAQKVATVHHRVLMAVPPKPDVTITKSTWMKRGWTYQESVLSHRLLVFGPTEVYFECDSLRCSEATDLPFNYDDLRVDPTEWHRRSLFPSITRTEHPGPFDDIFERIQNYSTRLLTSSSDAESAIRGILNLYGRIYPQLITLWGLPLVPEKRLKLAGANTTRPFTRTEHLLRSLCWFPGRQGTRNTDFPSFSWLGWSMGNHRVIAPYGYVINSFNIKVHVQSSSAEASEKSFEDWCLMEQTLRYSGGKPRSLILDVSTIKATVMSLLCRDQSRQYFVIFPGQPNIMMKNDVKLTVRKESLGDSSSTAYMENLLAIPVGTLVSHAGLDDSSVDLPVLPGASDSYMMLLVQEVRDGFERVGLVEFNSIGGGYMVPSTVQLPDGSSVRKRYYTPEAFRRLPFSRRRIRLV